MGIASGSNAPAAALLQHSEVQSAVKVTVVYFLVFFLAICNQARVKFALMAEARKKDIKFNRYENRDPRMLKADRIVDNTLEWMGAFLALFWLAVLFAGGSGCVLAGWVYVIARLVYIVACASLDLIRRNGVQPAIVASTIPMYVCLFFFGFQAFSAAV